MSLERNVNRTCGLVFLQKGCKKNITPNFFKPKVLIYVSTVAIRGKSYIADNSKLSSETITEN